MDNSFPDTVFPSSLFLSSWVQSIPDHLPPIISTILRSTLKDRQQPILILCDRITWKQVNAAGFTLKAAWNCIRSKINRIRWAFLVWNNLLRPQISCFAWKLFHNRLPTSAWTRLIGFQLTTCCSFCLSPDESVTDLLFLWSCFFIVIYTVWRARNHLFLKTRILLLSPFEMEFK